MTRADKRVKLQNIKANVETLIDIMSNPAEVENNTDQVIIKNLIKHLDQIRQSNDRTKEFIRFAEGAKQPFIYQRGNVRIRSKSRN